VLGVRENRTNKMRKPKEGFWGDITIKQVLFWTIWTLGILGWVYFIVSFTATRAEANQTWAHVQEIQKQRRENKSSGEENVISSSTESTEQLEGEADDTLPVSPPSIIETIYEVAKEKQFEDPELLVRIARAESSLQACVKNPNSSAIGLYQILDLHGLTKKERCNPRIATAWTIDKINAGGISAWNSSKSKWDNS